jgi:hypothetical protein
MKLFQECSYKTTKCFCLLFRNVLKTFQKCFSQKFFMKHFLRKQRSTNFVKKLFFFFSCNLLLRWFSPKRRQHVISQHQWHGRIESERDVGGTIQNITIRNRPLWSQLPGTRKLKVREVGEVEIDTRYKNRCIMTYWANSQHFASKSKSQHQRRKSYPNFS